MLPGAASTWYLRSAPGQDAGFCVFFVGFWDLTGLAQKKKIHKQQSKGAKLKKATPASGRRVDIFQACLCAPAALSGLFLLRGLEHANALYAASTRFSEGVRREILMFLINAPISGSCLCKVRHGCRPAQHKKRCGTAPGPQQGLFLEGSTASRVEPPCLCPMSSVYLLGPRRKPLGM